MVRSSGPVVPAADAAVAERRPPRARPI